MIGKANRGIEATEVYSVLSNERRQHTLEALREEGSLTTRDLAERIASIEAGESPPPRNVRQSVYVSLKQTHLPHLERLEVVEAGNDGVRLTARADDVTVYTEVVTRYGLAWSEYYALVAFLGLIAAVGAAVEAPGLGAVDPAVFAVGALGVAFSSAMYQTWKQGRSILSRP